MEYKTVPEPEMTKEEFIMIRDFIHEKCGIFFAENKTYLVKNRLIKRMKDLGINSYRDYFYHVKYDTSQKEFTALVGLITTNETSFFRNEPQLLSFSEEVLPKIIKEKDNERGPKKIKIWSAGCSTGEEPYTLAIILKEKIKDFANWKIEIIANDISEPVLQKARKGVYSGITLRNMKSDILKKYFTKQNEDYKVNQEIKSMVNFSHMNLNDPRRITMSSNFDTVFCRDVMIYFSEEIKKQLVRGFFNSLRPGGYFYIGHSETLHGISKAFKLVYLKNALVYNKEKVGTDTQNKSATGISVRRPTMLVNKKTDPAGGATRAMELLSKIKKNTAAAKR